MNPMPVWELIVVSFAVLLASFTISLPLLIGDRLDRRREAVARKAPVQAPVSPPDEVRRAA